MYQTIKIEDFWARYGHSELSETAFMVALSRLPKVSSEGPWVAGGSVRRLVSYLEQDSDFDFFFRDDDQFKKFCSDMSGLGARKLFENDFNITYMLPADYEIDEEWDSTKGPLRPELKVQAIRIAFHETLEAVLESFDFSLCQCGFNGENLIFGQWTLYDLANKKLVPGKLSYGTSSLRRVIKYTKQGYGICNGGLAEILEQIADNPELIRRDVEYVD